MGECGGGRVETHSCFVFAESAFGSDAPPLVSSEGSIAVAVAIVVLLGEIFDRILELEL